MARNPSQGQGTRGVADETPPAPAHHASPDPEAVTSPMDFSTTQWRVVLAARGEAPSARKALAGLCERYWPPLYAFFRRHGCAGEDAQDLTQGLFLSLLQSDGLRNVQPEKGRFRTFLLAAARHHLTDEHRRAHAQKRGGGMLPFSLDAAGEEARLGLEAADSLTPEVIYERRWVLALLESTLERMAKEAQAQGNGQMFAQLRDYLTREEPPAPYAEAAAELQMTEDAVKVAVHRLRRRFTEALRAEIAHTLANPDDVDDEIRHLFSLYE